MTADLPPSRNISVQDVQSNYELEGSDGQHLMEQFELVIKHWQSRPSLALETPDEYDIRHVPFKKVGSIKVRFKGARPMRPRRFEAGDFQEE